MRPYILHQRKTSQKLKPISKVKINMKMKPNSKRKKEEGVVRNQTL